MVHKTRIDRIHNDKIRETLNVEKLTTDIEKNRLKWFWTSEKNGKGKTTTKNIKSQGTRKMTTKKVTGKLD